MKRVICILLILAWILCLAGCAAEKEELQDPVRFYYPKTKATYGSIDGVIAWEERESAGHTEDYVYLVELYLKGPESEGLSRTFPKNVTIRDLHIVGDTAQVILNDYAARLTGLDLTIACVCLAATVTDLIGVQSVTIQAETALLDGNPSITMDRDKILLLDESAN